MPDLRDQPLARWGEELRRARSMRRARRWRAGTILLAGLAIVGALGTSLWPPRPALVWNESASAPLGLYRVTAPTRVRVGDMVLAWTPDPARRVAAERHYLPANIPVVKPVAGAAGDRVCAIGEAIFVNGRLAATRALLDPKGRELPWWTGCTTLRDGELFLLTGYGPRSFDGRYFGITGPRLIVGRAWHLWP